MVETKDTSTNQQEVQASAASTLQAKYIWKVTEKDGILPISNFTQDVTEKSSKRKGKDKAASQATNFGKITKFDENEEEEDEEYQDEVDHSEPTLQLRKNEYVWFGNRECFALVVKNNSGSSCVFKMPKLEGESAAEEKKSWDFDELEFD